MNHINKNPGVCGGDARIRDTRHTVAGLVQWKQLGLTDERILEHHPDLTLDDLNSAWSYYESHREEINTAISANERARINSSVAHPATGSGYLTPELLEWARNDLSEEEIVAGLREIRSTGGLELKDFIHELEQEAAPRD
jgi:uncharacterized protein (DUF433 family)